MFTTKDPYGREISLYKSEWKHIQTAHPEFTFWEPIKTTIEEPNIIGMSKINEQREIYYKLGAYKKYPHLYVAVVAEIKDEFGKITTSHLADKPTKIHKGRIKYVKR